MNEEDIEILEAIENDLKTIDLYKNTYDIKYAKLLDLYNKQKENNKKLQEGYDKRVGEILKLEQRIEELEEIEEEHRKENGKLQEKIKELEEENKKYPIKMTDEQYKKVIDLAQKDIKEELERQINTRIINEEFIENNFISKDKIKEKIEELEVMSVSTDIYYEDIKKMFEELLEEQEDK